jgi:hypothetical protein
MSERERCESWLLNYWRSRGYGNQLTEAEHLAGLRRSGALDQTWEIWQGALGTGSAAGHTTAEFSNLSTQAHGYGVPTSQRSQS